MGRKQERKTKRKGCRWEYRGAFSELEVQRVDLLEDALGVLERRAARLRQRS